MRRRSWLSRTRTRTRSRGHMWSQDHELWLRLNYVRPRLARRSHDSFTRIDRMWQGNGSGNGNGFWSHYIDSGTVIRFIKKFPHESCWCFMQVMNIAGRRKFASSAAVLIRAQNQRRNFDALLMKQLSDAHGCITRQAAQAQAQAHPLQVKHCFCWLRDTVSNASMPPTYTDCV